MMISIIIFYVHTTVINTKLKQGTHIFTREMYTYAYITSRWHFCDEHERAKDVPVLKTITVHGFH